MIWRGLPETSGIEVVSQTAERSKKSESSLAQLVFTHERLSGSQRFRNIALPEVGLFSDLA